MPHSSNSASASGAKTGAARSAAVGGATFSKASQLVVWIVLISTFVVFLNETILSVAIPPIMAEFNIPASTGQWLSTSYLLTTAVIIPTTGFLLQRFSTRTMFGVAMSLFVIGTIVAAIAPDFSTLLAGRIVQASGTAIMMPLLITTVMILVPEKSRGSFMGTIGIVMSVAPAIGPAVSGLILSFANWRWLFWLVLPIAVTALVVGYVLLKPNAQERPPRMDVLSVILSAFGFSTLVYGLSSFGQQAMGENVLSPYVPLAAGAIFTGMFIWRQFSLQRTDRALLDLRTFKSTSFSLAIIMMGAAVLTLFGVIILLPIYMQDVLGLSPLVSGLLLLPGGLLMGLLGPPVGRLYDRHGVRVLIIPGTIVMSGALWLMATFNASTSPFIVITAHIVMSIGLALIFTPLFTVGMSSVPKQLYSHASATVSTVQQVAGAAGTALFITIYSAVMRSQEQHGVATTPAMAAGMQWAFIGAAIISVTLVVLSFFMRRPATAEEMSVELETSSS